MGWSIEDLKAKDWIIVIDHVPPEMTYEQRNNYFPPPLDGLPHEVLGVSAPFVVVRPVDEPDKCFSIDTRTWIIRKATASYVKPYQQKNKELINSVGDFTKNTNRRNTSYLCPVCEEGTFHVVYRKSSSASIECKNCKAKVVEQSRRG